MYPYCAEPRPLLVETVFFVVVVVSCLLIFVGPQILYTDAYIGHHI